MTRARSAGVLATLIILTILASTFVVGTAHAAPTTITAYKSTIAVSVKGAYSASGWTDTPTMTEPNSGVTFAAKQNGTGWLFLMMWKQSPGFCSDNACYGGIELGSLSNTGEMGNPSTPTIMILGSPLFQATAGHTVDEFISTGDQTPTSVEGLNYATQSVCGALTLTGTTYTVQCYRPFTLKNASPYDFPTLGVGSTIEIGFAVGEFNSPGDHAATTMSSYVLTFSGSTYSGSSTTSTTSTTPTTTSTTSTTTTTTTSTSTTKSTTTTTSTTPTTTTTTTSTTPTTTTTTTTSTSTSKSTTTTTSTTPTTASSTATTSTGTGSGYTVKVVTNAPTYQNTQTGTITVTIAPAPGAGTVVQLQVTNAYKTVLFTAAAPVSAGGTASANFTAGSPSWEWVNGPYSVSASWSPTGTTTVIVASAQFTYAGQSGVTSTTTATSATVTVTSTAPATTQTTTKTATVTSTQSVTGPATTATVTSTQSVTGPATTATVTSTQSVISTSTSTLTSPPSTVTSTSTRISTLTQSSSSIPAWAYGVMAVLLIAGLAIGYVVKRPSAKQG